MTDFISRSRLYRKAAQMEDAAIANMIRHAGEDAAYRYVIQASERKMFKGCIESAEDVGEEIIKIIEARRDLIPVNDMFNCGRIAAYDEVINLIRGEIF